jgi:hypothetical protein
MLCTQLMFLDRPTGKMGQIFYIIGPFFMFWPIGNVSKEFVNGPSYENHPTSNFFTTSYGNLLVGGIPTPLKNMTSSVIMIHSQLNGKS